MVGNHHASSPCVLDVAAMQSSLSKKTRTCDNNRPKTLGQHERFEKLRSKESDTIFFKSAINLPFLVKKKVEKLLRQKDFGTYVIETDLLANEENDCVGYDDNEGDLTDRK